MRKVTKTVPTGGLVVARAQKGAMMFCALDLSLAALLKEIEGLKKEVADLKAAAKERR